MKGYVKLEASTENKDQRLSVTCHLERVGAHDKMILMHALKEAIEMSEDEFMIYVLGEEVNAFGNAKTSSVQIKIPTKELSDDES